MTAIQSPATARRWPAPAKFPLARMLRAYRMECWFEILRLIRVPAFIAPIVLVPLLIFFFFGSVMHVVRGELAMYRFLITICIFGAVSPGLFGFGLSVALERSQGLLVLKRAQPVPPGAYLGAKVVMAVVMAASVTLLLVCAAALTGQVRIGVGQGALLVLVATCSVVPFSALGLLIGTVLSGQVAPMVTNLLFMMMSALSGLWIPLQAMSPAMRQAAVIWPSYHAILLAYGVMGVDSGVDPIVHALVLIVFSAVFFALAVRRLARYG